MVTSYEAPSGEDAELGKWNWGAFLLSWIWGIGNRVWISLLALIPVVGLVMMFGLGFKDNRWAWERKQWRDIAHFHSTQRKWAIAGLAWTVGWIALGLLVALAGSESEGGDLG